MAETFTQEDPTKVKPGIVASAVEPVKATSAVEPYKAPEVKPVTTEVAPETETVEGRLSKLTEAGSKYIDVAKQDAMKTAQKRGLINTSIAAGAGTEAGIRSALPIAQQDARTYTETRAANQAQINEFLKNRQSASLNMETAGHASELAKGEAMLGSELKTGEMEVAHQFDIDRDKSSADLNMKLAEFDSTLKMAEMELDADLKLGFETALNDARFSDESKLQIVTAMNTIIRDTQQQITDIGLSDRSAAQQATAIQLAMDNRDSQIGVYEELLSSFNDWEWGTDFTSVSAYGGTGESAGGGATGGGEALDEYTSNVNDQYQAALSELGPRPTMSDYRDDYGEKDAWDRAKAAIDAEYGR